MDAKEVIERVLTEHFWGTSRREMAERIAAAMEAAGKPKAVPTRGQVVAAASVNDIGGSILRIGNEVHCGVAFRIAPKVSDILPTLREVVAALIDAERADAAKGERAYVLDVIRQIRAGWPGWVDAMNHLGDIIDERERDAMKEGK